MQRETTLTAVSINLPNQVQDNVPQGGLRVLQTGIDRITAADGSTVGYPTQWQRPMIGSDLSPAVLEALNAQLAYLGVALTPIAQAAATE